MSQESNDYDVIIVGGGPAGLTAGIYTARSGLKAIIFEERALGGSMSEATLIENYPGFLEGITGLELANKMEIQAKKWGVKINSPEKVVELKLQEENKIVITDKNIYRASAVILSLGCSYRRLDVPGERKLRGKGVSYCAICDGRFFKDKRVLVIGGGNNSVMTAIYLSNLASNVQITHRKKSFRAEYALVKQLQDNKVDIILNMKVAEIRGETMVQDVILEDVETGKKRVIEVEGVFVQIGEEPASRIAKNAGVRTNAEGYIVVDCQQKTNLKGVYAAGDVVNYPIKQIGTAVGQAITAAVEAFRYIKRPYYFYE